MAKKKSRPTLKDDSPHPPHAASGWRLFLAIQLPDHVRAIVTALNQQLAKPELPLRLVDPRLAHITLHFLGSTEPERAELLSLALPASVAGKRALMLSSSGLGCFPSERKPRVVWLGMEGEIESLRAINASLAKTLQIHGFETETRPLHPHVTLARAREGWSPTLAAELQTVLVSDAVRNIVSSEPREFLVDEIALIRSHLEKTGPRYETIRTVKLGTRG